MKHLGFASVQRCVLKHAERRGRLGEMGAGDSQPPSINEQWVELNEAAVSKISLNYVTNIQLAHFAKAETYFNQWHEQHVPNTELVHVDHHGKRDAAIRLNGSKDLMWTYTEMNGLGHKTLSVKCNTTSMNDSSLVAAYDRRVRASARWNLIKVCRFLHLSRACQFRALGDDIFSLSRSDRSQVRRVTSDNPRKDGAGIKAKRVSWQRPSHLRLRRGDHRGYHGGRVRHGRRIF